MIYGKLSLKDWRTARVEGETPESSFESYNFRLFFFGTLYNRDQLQSIVVLWFSEGENTIKK